MLVYSKLPIPGYMHEYNKYWQAVVVHRLQLGYCYLYMYHRVVYTWVCMSDSLVWLC